MACDITSGYTLGCRDNTGGIKNIYILSGSVSTITGTTGLITQISGAGTFYKFELFRQTGNLTENINVAPENGTVFYEQNVTAVFHKLQSATRNKVRVLAKNPNIKMIVETNNGSEDGVGTFFYMGQENGVQLTSGVSQTGTAFGDLNGYTLNFVGQEPEPASELSGSNLAGVLSGITIG
jgi:hypothetical protein